MPEKHTLRDLDLGGIEVMVDRLRKLRPEKVDALAKSIRMQGLLQPIIVRPKNGTGYLLVVGHHRLEAIRNLHREGHWPSGAIRAEIVDEMDDDAALLAEIDENLIRADLSPAETAIHIARRKELYERLHPETKAGVAGGKASGRKRANKSQNESRSGFVKDTAKKTGKGRSTIAKAATRSKKIKPDVLKDVVGTSLDQGDQIDALAKLPEEEQRKLAEAAKAGEEVSAKTVVRHGGRASTKADGNRDVESFCAAFGALELAIQDVRGDNLRLAANELGEGRILRVVSGLKSALDDYGSRRQRVTDVKSAADRAEARAQRKSTL